MVELELPNLRHVDDFQALTKSWCAGKMTNFEYLTKLNKTAGRSFNDLMQYPVMPFVLADYTSQVLDLESTNSYRLVLYSLFVYLILCKNFCKENYENLKIYINYFFLHIGVWVNRYRFKTRTVSSISGKGIGFWRRIIRTALKMREGSRLLHFITDHITQTGG